MREGDDALQVTEVNRVRLNSLFSSLLHWCLFHPISLFELGFKVIVSLKMTSLIKQPVHALCNSVRWFRLKEEMTRAAPMLKPDMKCFTVLFVYLCVVSSLPPNVESNALV